MNLRFPICNERHLHNKNLIYPHTGTRVGCDLGADEDKAV